MDRKLTTLTIAYATQYIGYGLNWVLLTIYVYEMGATYLQVALLAALPATTYLTQRVWGAVSDFYGTRKPFMVVGTFLSGLAIFTYPWIKEPNYVIVVATIVAFFSSISIPAITASLTTITEKKGAALGYYQTATSIGFTIGAILIWPIKDFIGISAAFVVSALSYLVCSLIILVFYPNRPLDRRTDKCTGAVKRALTFKTGFSTPFKWLVLTVLISFFGMEWVSPLLRIRVYELSGRLAMMYSLIMAGSSIVSAIVSPFYGRMVDSKGGKIALKTSIIAYTILFPILAVVNDSMLIAFLWLTPIYPAYYISINSMTADLTPEGERGEAMGTIGAALALGDVLSPLGGVFADSFGRESGIIAGSFLILVSLIALTRVTIDHINRDKK